jgi:uncharacterized membrane protein YdjX (TVP38/TMEM64 family)
MLPGTFMMLASGYVFGKAFANLFTALGVGSIATFAGMEFGSTSAMIIGRYIFRECVADLISSSKVMVALDNVLKKKGAKIIFLLRMTPLIPFNFMNYGMGATGVKVSSYMLGGFGTIPEMVVLLYIGSALR